MNNEKEQKKISKIAKEAILHARKTHEQTGKLGTIMERRDYDFIKKFLKEINEETRKKGVGVSIDDKHLRNKEVRFFYLKNQNHE